MSTRDFSQKLGAYKLLWTLGYLPELEVKLVFPQGSSRRNFELTDIDVVASGVTPDLCFDRILVDCKTERRISAINRAFWLKGVMKHIGAHRGYVVLNRQIQDDHKLAAQSMRITMLSEKEFEVFFTRMISPKSTAKMKMFDERSWHYYEENARNIKFADKLYRYRKCEFWLDSPEKSIRQCIYKTKSIAADFVVSQKLQTALILDTVTLFSLSFLRLAAQLFHLYLIPNNKQDMDAYLKAHLYGGQDDYSNYNEMYRIAKKLEFETQQSTANSVGIPDLELPEWSIFLKVFRQVVENPNRMRDVPRIFRFVLFERLLYDNSDVSVENAIPDVSSNSVSLALDLLEYFLKASNLYEVLWSRLNTYLLGILGEIENFDTSETIELVDRVDHGSLPRS